MTGAVFRNIIRFVVFALVQGLLLKRVEFSGTFFEHIHVFIYPLFILLLPLRTPTAAVIGLSFLIGITVDLFYLTIGVHAAAATAAGFFRQGVLAFLQPRGGYDLTYSPTARRMGTPWFLRYAAMLLAFHLFWYFSVEAFTFVYIVDILADTVVSFGFSLLFVMVYMAVFSPLE